jgi:hypothetical protein
MANPADTVAAFSSNTKSVTQLKTAADLNKKLDSLKRGRQLWENQWKLNLAFYKGRQYSYFNRASRRIESLPVEDGEKPRYRVRLVNNQIMSGAHSLLAKFTKTKPVMNASPGSGSDADLKSAQMAERLLEHWWDDLDLDDKLEEALLWAIIVGQGYWKIGWNPHAGKAMKFMLDPQGQPVVDDSLKELFKAQLAQQGVEPQEKVVYLGDVEVEAISPFNVFIDPSAKTFDEARFVICVHYLDPDEVFSRWGVTVTPDAVNASPDSTLPFQNAADSADPSVKAVNIGYFKPNPTMPKGRYVVFTDKQILADDPWPYPFNDLPIVKFPGLRVPGSIYDSSVVEHAIPLQKELNRTVSQIVEYKNLTIKPRYWAPTGSISTRMTSEPGLLMEYNPVGDHKPEVEKLPSMPPYVFDHLTGIRNALREIFALTEVTEGTVPPNVEAGIAIDLLQEMATDRLAPTIKLMEHTIASAGQLMLLLAQQYYIEPRLLKIKGSGGGIQVKKFTQSDIAGGISIQVQAGSALPRTRAGKQAQILELVKAGIIPPDKAYKHLDLADLRGIAAQMQADEDQALREHEKLITGGIINELDYRDALSQLESGQMVDPDTQQPVNDPQTAQHVLENAGLQPLPFENYQQHLETHSRFMTSVEYESLPLQLKQRFVTHFTQTLKTYMNLPKPVEYKPVSPTLQIKGTAGPTAVADILNKAGVLDITPQTMTEPPLDTWVTDDLSKQNVDASGNSQKDVVEAHAAVADMAQKQATHVAEHARMDQLHMANAAEAAAKADKAHAETVTHTAIAAQKLRTEAAKADLAERTAREKRINPPRPRSKKRGR